MHDYPININNNLEPLESLSFHFQIYAVETDSGTTQSTGEATVTIFILDENDNSPAFAEVLYTFEVREEAAAGILTSTTPSGLTMIQVWLSGS